MAGKFGHLFEVRRRMDEEAEAVDASPPVDQSPTAVSQSPTLGDQYTGVESLVDQSTGIPVSQSPSTPVSTPAEVEAAYPSRVNKRKKAIWLPTGKLDHYEDFQHRHRKRFRHFQDLVEWAMDQATGIPVSQSPSPPVDQSPALITNQLTNLVINDEKAEKALAHYARVSRRQPTQKDVDAYREVAHLPLEVIIAGVDETARRAAAAGRQYNGFRYGLNVIRDVSKSYQASTPPAEEKHPPDCRNCLGTGFLLTDQGRGPRCPKYVPGEGESSPPLTP